MKKLLIDLGGKIAIVQLSIAYNFRKEDIEEYRKLEKNRYGLIGSGTTEDDEKYKRLGELKAENVLKISNIRFVDTGQISIFSVNNYYDVTGEELEKIMEAVKLENELIPFNTITLEEYCIDY